MSTSTARQPKGLPIGGQFAATSHSEPITRLERRPDLSVDFDIEENGRGYAIHDSGSEHPTVTSLTTYGSMDRFRTEAGTAGGQSPSELAQSVLADARHAAACQAAWAAGEENFHEGDDARVTDFNVRRTNDGTRIIDLDLVRDGRHYSIVRHGDAEPEVYLEGHDAKLPLTDIQLDAIARDLDPDHDDGTGDIRFKAMMRESADRAEADPGYKYAL